MLCLWPLAQGALALEGSPAPSSSVTRAPNASVTRAAHGIDRSALRVPGLSGPGTGWARIPGDAPLALPSRALAGAASAAGPSRRLTVTVTLRRSDQAGFERYLEQVYDRGSPLYHRFLTPAQQADRFGPSASAYSRVRAWLVLNGFRVTQSSANRLSISARGTRAAAQRAFDTPIESFRAGRRAAYSNTEAPALPRALAPYVQAVSGLSDRAQPVSAPAHLDLPTTFSLCLGSELAVLGGFIGLTGGIFASVLADILTIIVFELGVLIPLAVGIAVVGVVGLVALTALCGVVASSGSSPPPPPPSGPPSPPCVPQPGAPCILISPDRPGSDRARRAARSSAAGAGDPAQKIGLLEFDTYRPSDVTDWLTLVGVDPGDSPASRLSEVNVNGGVGSPGAGESEVLLDIDTVLGLAPLAPTSYVVYDAPPSTSFVQMFQTMIAAGDTVISNSWSQCEDQTPIADAQAIDSVLASAAGAGVSVVNGTGDGGSTCLDGSANTVGVPADSPHATAVGGTTPTFGPGLSYGHESWWGSSASSPPSGAGGFGVSRYFTRPAFQKGLTSSSMRSVPDVAFNADPAAGLELCQADAGGCPNGLMSGGTSMAAPEVAAEVADLNASLGRDVGDLDAALYPLAGTSAFHTAASMGSDFAHVGLGSPDFSNVYLKLAGKSVGSVSGTQSLAVGVGQPQADGSQQGVVRVDLEDAKGLPVGGKAVTITPSAGSGATVTPASATTGSTDGAAVFTVTDTTPETVTFTVKDATDDITLTPQPQLTFVTPTATGASIVASPSTVVSDGSSAATISVYLQNALGQPAAGKTVSLSASGTHAAITPVTGQAVTGTDGVATFTVTDTTSEAVTFTATDVTDGSLPVPGSATVNFAVAGPPSCTQALPTGAGGFTVSPFASGLATNQQAIVTDVGGLAFTVPACDGAETPAFDASGNVYVPDDVSGQIYAFGPAGGSAGAGTALPGTTIAPGDNLDAIAFGKNGELWATVDATAGDHHDPELLELDPSTGATERVIATHTTALDGLDYCPQYNVAVDPLSGDVFTADDCSGALASFTITRVHDPDSASPTVTTYATETSAVVGLAFAPDGTLYALVCTGAGCDRIDSITGTDGPATPVITSDLATVANSAVGLAVASTNASGQATALEVADNKGNVYRIDLTQTPATVTTIAGGGGGATGTTENQPVGIGPDGCLYVARADTVYEVSGAGCGAAAAGPSITLTESSGSATPATGSSVGLTAVVSGVSGVSGTAVRFAISGPNLGARLADANGSGQASTSYGGVFQGVDTVTASAVVNGRTLTSAPVRIHWSAGKAATFLDLNASQPGGPVGQKATVSASLWDAARAPVSPVAGQSVTLALGGRTCTATTSAGGVASCKLAPAKVGLNVLSASYAGSSQYAASSATNLFDATVGTPVNTALPKVSGKAVPGKRLSCSKGSWSNSPKKFAYRWERDGRAIKGATKSRYTVGVGDGAAKLTCVVTASNSLGAGARATSAPILVAVKGTLRCPQPSGRLTGVRLGPLSLGMTRRQAQKKLHKHARIGFGFENFCLYAGFGIRVAFPSAALLRSVPSAERGKLRGRIVIALTANPRYSLQRVKPGAKLTGRVQHRLRLGQPFHIGLNYWYMAPGKSSTGVLKVRRGVIQEVGIANRALTRGRAAQLRFLHGFQHG
jgi:Pro-kumamolisin, activation domain/Bacterial Ig-like domain (group 1)